MNCFLCTRKQQSLWWHSVSFGVRVANHTLIYGCFWINRTVGVSPFQEPLVCLELVHSKRETCCAVVCADQQPYFCQPGKSNKDFEAFANRSRPQSQKPHLLFEKYIFQQTLTPHLQA